MPLRNLPTDTSRPLASLIDAAPGQVSSMALTRDASADMTLLAFSPGESVSEEEYFCDVMYYVVEGTARVAFADRAVKVPEGAVLKVSAHEEHAVESADGGAFKLLQIAVS